MENRKRLVPALRPVEDTDVTTWELPEGAIGRLGQGFPLDVEFSRDGSYLTVATKIGFWIYDTATMAPRALWGTERGMFVDWRYTMIVHSSLRPCVFAPLRSFFSQGLIPN